MQGRIEQVAALDNTREWPELAPIVPIPDQDVLAGSWHAGRLKSLRWDSLEGPTRRQVCRYKASCTTPARTSRFARISWATSSSTSSRAS